MCLLWSLYYEREQKAKCEEDFSRAFKSKLTLREMQEKKYPFLDSDDVEIFDELVELKPIELPEMKRPEEVGRIDDPSYCKYHRLVGYPLEKCFVFKDKVLQLADEKKIVLNDEKVDSNQISYHVWLTWPSPSMSLKKKSH